MSEPENIRLSNLQIKKATTRLAHQRAAIRQLGFQANATLAKVANETVVSMECRLAALVVGHARLLKTNVGEDVPD
jgi:hypothetical protein